MQIHQDPESYRHHLHKCLKINPHDIDALIHLGVLEFEYFHDHERAVLLLENAIQVDLLNVAAKFWLATCLYHDYCEYEKAEKLLEEALKIDSNRPECLSLMASIIRFTKRPLNAAIKYVQKAIQYAPDWPMLRYQLAGLLLDIGKIDAAEQEVANALQLTKSSSLIINNEVEEYYEDVVTGRNWSDLKKEFRYILENIQLAKLNK